MHYKNGREAKLGDNVISLELNDDRPVAGVLHKVYPGADACNGKIIASNGHSYMVTLGNCLHLDDIKAAADVTPDTSNKLG